MIFNPKVAVRIQFGPNRSVAGPSPKISITFSCNLLIKVETFWCLLHVILVISLVFPVEIKQNLKAVQLISALPAVFRSTFIWIILIWSLQNKRLLLFLKEKKLCLSALLNFLWNINVSKKILFVGKWEPVKEISFDLVTLPHVLPL